MLRDLRAADPQVLAAAQVISAAAPDVILLTGFDWDLNGLALVEFGKILAESGHPMPYSFSARPNSGLATGLDLNGDGRKGRADDAQGFGQFSGQNGMAILSRMPLGDVIDYTDFLWRDLPDNLMPALSDDIAAIQFLSSTAHWDVEVQTSSGPLHLLAWSATPPVFDGPEDLNGRRNHDEALFWLHHLPDAPYILLGNINLDLVDGDGRPDAIHALLQATQDPQPQGAYQPPQTGINQRQKGDPRLDTAVFADDAAGNLRVDYVLPARSLTIIRSAVVWPTPDDPMAIAVETASNHRLVWVDIEMPQSGVHSGDTR